MNIQKLFAVVTLAAQSTLSPNLFGASAQALGIARKLSNTAVLVGDKAMPSLGAPGAEPFIRERFSNGKSISTSAEETDRLISTVASGEFGNVGPAVSVFLNNPFRICRNQNDNPFLADRGVYFATDNLVTPGTSHPSVNTRARSRKNFHCGFTIALHVFLSLKPSGMIATKPNAAQPISLLNAGFSRAPPRVGLSVQSRFDGALDHALFHRHAALPFFGICPRVSLSIFAAILEIIHSSPVDPASEGVQA